MISLSNLIQFKLSPETMWGGVGHEHGGGTSGSSPEDIHVPIVEIPTTAPAPEPQPIPPQPEP